MSPEFAKDAEPHADASLGDLKQRIDEMQHQLDAYAKKEKGEA